MSTRATIIYKPENGVHIYSEMNDYDNIYIEVVRDGVTVTCVLMPMSEWKARGLPTTYQREIPPRRKP